MAPLAIVRYPPGSDYTVSRILDAFARVLPSFETTTSTERVAAQDLQWCDYDLIDWDAVQRDPRALVNAYAIRKALTRKHHLPLTVAQHLAKHPESCLKAALPQTWTFELAYADELDELWADELYELKTLLDASDGTYILKPAMADRGQGIRILRSQEELEAVLAEFEAAQTSEEEDEEESTNVELSRMRWWVVQCYIDHPLLINKRKFHLRAYVLAVGALQVYLYTDMLALFAPTAYEPGSSDLSSHLTNTCLQGDTPANDAVRRFADLPLSLDARERTVSGIAAIVGETWQAALGSGSHFQPLPNAFELYGVDLLLDEALQPYLLEVNAGPDFKQTGEQRADLIDRLFEATLRVAVAPHFGEPALGKWEVRDERWGFRKCLDVAVRSWT